MKYVGPVRKELGVRTVFNLLGPLTNPGHANLQVLGVYSEALLEPMAKVLCQLGVKNGMSSMDRISWMRFPPVRRLPSVNFRMVHTVPM